MSDEEYVERLEERVEFLRDALERVASREGFVGIGMLDKNNPGDREALAIKRFARLVLDGCDVNGAEGIVRAEVNAEFAAFVRKIAKETTCHEVRDLFREREP